MQITIEIKDDSIGDKILWFLNNLKDKGIEIVHSQDGSTSKKQENKKDDEDKFSDEYIEKNWLDIIRQAHVPEDYENSEQYIEDRVKDWEERGKI